VFTYKAGYGLQRLNGVRNQFMSLGADYALSRRTTLYASLGNRQAAQTSFGVGISHSY